MGKHTEIKTLVIYKQHYRESHDVPLESQFSCMGYYNAISLFDEDIARISPLFPKKTNSPISTIWYGMQGVASELNGRFSTQIVGLFRESDGGAEKDNTGRYTDYPYITVLFIQLEREQNEVEAAHAIERRYAGRGSEDSKNKISVETTYPPPMLPCRYN